MRTCWVFAQTVTNSILLANMYSYFKLAYVAIYIAKLYLAIIIIKRPAPQLVLKIKTLINGCQQLTKIFITKLLLIIKS